VGLVTILFGGVLILALIAPVLLNRQGVKELLLPHVSRSLGGTVRFGRIDAQFLPRPRVVVLQGTCDLDGGVHIRWESLAVRPQIRALLRGRFRPASLELEAPRIEAPLALNPLGRGAGRGEVSGRDLARMVASGMGRLASVFPVGVVTWKDGAVELLEKEGPGFWFRDLSGVMKKSADALTMEVEARSNLAEKVRLTARLDPDGPKGRCGLRISGLRPYLLTQRFPETMGRLRDGSLVNINGHVALEGSGSVDGNLVIAAKHLELFQEGHAHILDNAKVELSFHVDDRNTTLEVRELLVGDPVQGLRGRVRFDRQDGRIDLDLYADRLRVGPVRDFFTAFAAHSVPVRAVFDRLRDGSVSDLALHLGPAQRKDPDILDTLRVQGVLTDAAVYVPQPRLNLEQVGADFVVADGILEARDLHGRWGNTEGLGGYLKAGIRGKPAPFHLETHIRADLSQVPPLLESLAQSETLRREIVNTTQLDGFAAGRLLLGERTDALHATLEISDLRFQACHARLPHPLAVSSGALSYHGRDIRLTNLNGTLGASSFEGLSLHLNQDPGGGLEGTARACALQVEQAWSWLSTLVPWQNLREGVKDARGLLTLRTVHVNVPLEGPSHWRFTARGDIEDLTVDTPHGDGSFQVPRAVFTVARDAQSETLNIEQARLEFLDALVSCTGSLTPIMKAEGGLQLAGEGLLGPKAVAWVSRALSLPAPVTLPSPLILTGAHLSWSRGRKSRFAGTLAVADGPTLAMDVLRTPEGLRIGDLSIRDDTSRATITAHADKQGWEVAFTGTLASGTAARFLALQGTSGGSVTGAFRVRVPTDAPMQSTMDGTITGRDIVLSLPGADPLEIRAVTLEAAGSRLRVHDADIAWGPSRGRLSGNVLLGADTLILDLDLSADSFDAQRLAAWLPVGKEKGGTGQAPESPRLPVRGEIRMKVRNLGYKQYMWQPFHADITLERDGVKAAVTRAELCGLSFTGTVDAGSAATAVQMKPGAHAGDLEDALACFGLQDRTITGTFDIDGQISAESPPGALARSLAGPLTLTAFDGRIYRLTVLSKLLALLNVTEILAGRLPDLVREGFSYDSLQIQGVLDKGTIRIEKLFLDASSMKITGQGQWDPASGLLDLELLVAPLKTVDRVIRHIPLLGDILGGSLVSIPFHVKGPVNDPQVTPLPPAAVGAGLLRIAREVLRLPVRILQPILPSRP